jgi:hypothetical protein
MNLVHLGIDADQYEVIIDLDAVTDVRRYLSIGTGHPSVWVTLGTTESFRQDTDRWVARSFRFKDAQADAVWAWFQARVTARVGSEPSMSTGAHGDQPGTLADESSDDQPG